VKEKNNIIRILEKSKKALFEKDTIALKNLSNRTIHTASITQDPDNIAVAVIIYSLSKIIEREQYKKYGDFPRFLKKYSEVIEEAKRAAEKNDIEKFRTEMQKITKQINKLSSNLKKQIKHVFERAKINKASKIYEHGISMEQTAKLLGITIWELAEYAGPTPVSDVNLNITLPEKTRIKNLMELFKK